EGWPLSGLRHLQSAALRPWRSAELCIRSENHLLFSVRAYPAAGRSRLPARNEPSAENAANHNPAPEPLYGACWPARRSASRCKTGRTIERKPEIRKG